MRENTVNEHKEREIAMTDAPLTEHFRLSEFTRSGTALQHNIDNRAPREAVVCLRLLCENVLEPLRRRFGAIRISSGYRCEELNSLVGGARHSQHLRGQAADLHIASMEVGRKMFDFIRDHLDYDQLFFERRQSNGCRWLHVSYNPLPGRNRRHAGTITVE